MAEIIFERKIYEKMLAWKNERKGKTALLVNGARRVGKSTIVKAFAAQEYTSWILIDFAKAPDEVKELFNHLDDLDFLFLRLQSIFHVDLIERKSVIIFDEVQTCPQARQAIKYLVEDGRYDYIETGSLLSIRKNTEKILIPSEETRITMFPMDYEEFLWAMGDKQTMPLIRHAFENLRGLGDDMNRRLMRQFRLYMLVGGMPQAVNEYIASNNLAATDAVKREIIELYLDDLRKIDGTDRAARIFKSAPGELAKSKLHYQVGSVIKNAEPSRMEHVWQELEDSITVNFCYRCSDPNIGMALHKDYDKFKIFIGDTGLFVTLAFWDKDVIDNLIYPKLLSDKLSADLGYVYENVVAQSLRAAGHTLFYYFFQADAESKNHYEIDFMLSKGNKIIPIEVKSSGYKTHKSLDMFSQKYSARIGKRILLYTKDLRKEGGVLYLPIYMAGLL
ncbi:MAG: AAA family ATPase [Bacteroides sp.]|nr:AAA family ATPase [Bacteroides sp.]MCM1086179.1 AAA family ATPase [Bacteroides sp.]